MRLILASASPRRAELLRAAGFTFVTLAVEVDERVPPGEPPAVYVRRLAAEKSAMAIERLQLTSQPLVAQAFRPAWFDRLTTPRAGRGANAGLKPRATDLKPVVVSPQTDDDVVVAADTAVVVDGEILGKPRDAGDAEAMLRRLSGRRHDVMTGVSVRMGETERGRVETTGVYWTEVSSADVSRHVASGEGRDKAGGYAIQGMASRFVSRIEGSYSNVVGLPVGCMLELLRELRAR